MLKRITVVLLILLLLMTASACKPIAEPDQGDERLQIVTSFYVLYDFASRIGGDHVVVTNLVPPGAEPHHWEPDASDLVRLEKADLLIFNGAGMEHWVEKVTSSLTNKDLVMVETTKGLSLLAAGHSYDHDDDALEEENHDEEEDEEMTGQFDPHVWLDPVKARHQLNMIRDALIAARPEYAADFRAAADLAAAELTALDDAYREALRDLTRREIIVAHEAFAYLTEAYGLQQIGIEGLASETEPDPARMAEIITFAQEHDVKVIFFEELASPKVAETIAREIGARTAVLNPLEGLTAEQISAGEDYFSIMRQNLEALVGALS